MMMSSLSMEFWIWCWRFRNNRKNAGCSVLDALSLILRPVKMEKGVRFYFKGPQALISACGPKNDRLGIGGGNGTVLFQAFPVRKKLPRIILKDMGWKKDFANFMLETLNRLKGFCSAGTHGIRSG